MINYMNMAQNNSASGNSHNQNTANLNQQQQAQNMENIAKMIQLATMFI